MNLLAVVAGTVAGPPPSLTAAAEGGGLAINVFWIVVSALNFVVFGVVLYLMFGRSISRILAERRERIAQGIEDAEQAHRDRESAEQERVAALTEARREANEIIGRAQRVAQETRDADIATTRAELDRMRTRATAEIEAEKQRAIADLRAEVADLALAAAGKVVGESMTGERQRRLVEEFLHETAGPAKRAG